MLHIWSALDGNGLDGRRGLAGVLATSYDDVTDTFGDVRIRYPEGIAAGHAVQYGPPGVDGRRLLHLGTFCGMSAFLYADTLEAFLPPGVPDFEDPYNPAPASWHGWTHVAWLGPHRILVPRLDGYFWEYDLDHPDDEPVRRGAYKVPLVHGLKMSPDGTFLAYGSMDTNAGGPSRIMGIYDVAKHTATIVPMRETTWHMGIAPDSSCIGCVSECYEPGPPKSSREINYDDLAIGWQTNSVTKVERPKPGCVAKKRRISASAMMPNHLSSDVIALGDKSWTVIANACASSTIAVSEVHTGRMRYIDERVGFLELLRHPRFIGAALWNLMEAGTMMHLFGNTHHLIRALRISRGSMLDGSYGLAINKAHTRLISGHRGRNELLVYDISNLHELCQPENRYIKPPVVRRLVLPPLRKFMPGIVGRFADQRLGLHHMAYLEE